MSGGWLAEAGADPGASAREIARARDTFLSTALSARPPSATGLGVRRVVAESWQRSARAHVDPGKDPPVLLVDDDLAAHRDAHPLAGVIGLLRELVGVAAEDGKHLMAVSDAAGRLLWVEGHAEARRRAEAMNFVEGAVWDEAHAGTNAPGTALALDHAVQIFSAEHFRPDVQAWTCAAAPIHDPATGRILGIVDVTGGDMVAHPHSLALVTAAARAAEAQLAWRRDSPAELWTPLSCRPVRLAALGRDQCEVRFGGAAEVRLNRRPSEIAVLLARHPEGLTGDQLASALYDDGGLQGSAGAETTVRVEVARLRRALGGLVRSRPYRLDPLPGADFLDVATALQSGDVLQAFAGYEGSLLPRSEAPAVIAERHWLDARLRIAVLESGDPVVVEDWARRFGADDLDAWQTLVRVLPPGPRRADAEARVRRLRGPARSSGSSDLSGPSDPASRATSG